MRQKLYKITVFLTDTLLDNLYVKPREIAKLCLRHSLVFGKSYYPELPCKSKSRIFFEQLRNIISKGYPNEFYYPYGFDTKSGKEMKEYLHYEPFKLLRDGRNASPHSATAVLRDKVLFGMLTEYLGVNSSENVGITSPEGVFDFRIKKNIPFGSFFGQNRNCDLVVKPVDGECGDGIIHLVSSDGSFVANGIESDIHTLAGRLGAARYLVQRTVSQHPAMSSLHPQSLNTIRLVTVRNLKTKRLEVFPSILRIGTGGSFVDNTSQGGIAVGIDMETGRLKEYGFYKPAYGTRVSSHPDSGIAFSDFTIPHFGECKEQALLLHTMLPSIHSIGWDIAVGPDGPVFIEGNDNWEINGPQICNGGLKNRFLEACGI